MPNKKGCCFVAGDFARTGEAKSTVKDVAAASHSLLLFTAGDDPRLRPCPFRKCDPERFATSGRIVTSSSSMLTILHMLLIFVASLFKSRSRLEAENLFLRHQLSIALRRARPRLRLRGGDRVLLVWMVRLWPTLLGMAKVVQPETILRWHRSGFKAFWRWGRAAEGRSRATRSYPTDGQRESTMGCSPDPWRAADAGVRSSPIDSLQIHEAGSGAAVAILEDVSSKPR
jgi:hypothetical protein